MVFDNELILTLARPTVLKVQHNLYVAYFEIMKLIPAAFILSHALDSGELNKESHVIESSSGTFALALAIVCKQMGLKISLVTGPLDSTTTWRLETLGANLLSAKQGKEVGGIQQARLDLLFDLMSTSESYFWPRQYDNPGNPASYAWFIETLDIHVDCLVATVGSGGSISGCSRALTQRDYPAYVIAVDSPKSVLFGSGLRVANPLCDYGYESLLGMGADILMPNLDYELCDEVHWLPIYQMVHSCHNFYHLSGRLTGLTGGAAFQVAKWYAANNPNKVTLALLPDSGLRYVNSVYNPDWHEQWKSELRRHDTQPIDVLHPTQATTGWSRFMWSRRTYAEIMCSHAEDR